MNTQNPIDVLIRGTWYRAQEHTVWPDGVATGTLGDGSSFRVPRWAWLELLPWQVKAESLQTK
jgi:hypothetical protein